VDVVGDIGFVGIEHACGRHAGSDLACGGNSSM
jgi:hypothetical protein